MASEETPEIVLPGDTIGLATENKAGAGTYRIGSEIYASIWGCVKKDTDSSSDSKDRRPVISVHHTHTGMKVAGERMVAPQIKSIVTARVITANSRFCKAEILAVGSQMLTEPFHGVLRKEDVRATEKDSVDIYKSFRPEDFIRARVIGLGDAMSYVLSTAENELGVVHAVGKVSGVAMVPVSWCEMQCPATGGTEHRKVAKVKTAVSIMDNDR